MRLNRPSAALITGLAVSLIAVVAIADAGFAAQGPFGVLTPDGGGSFGGPLAPVFAWIREWQVELNELLRGEMATLKENGAAVWLLLAFSFLYGIFHAAGPGHGKAVITSFLLASGDSARRGVLLSFAAAFVQALTAILVVGIANMIFQVTAKTMTSATNWLEVGSYALIALVGAWLLWSKTFGGGHHHHHHFAVASGPDVDGGRAHGHTHHAHDDHDHHGHGAHDHDHHHPGDHAHAAVHDHDHDHGHHHHDHDVAVAHVSAMQSNGEARSGATGQPRSILLRAWSAILAVGIRPCSGAILILVFAVGQGMIWAGVASTFAMALGTGLTVAVLAALAVSAKDFAVRFAGPESEAASWILRTVEIAGAAAVLLFGLLLLGGALSGGGPT